MWVGTPVGLLRFDGDHFKKFPLTDFFGNTDSGIQKLLPSHTDGLWIFYFNKPMVGLSPTTPLTPAGETMLPSVSVPSETAVRLAEAAAADPELEPLGLRAMP